MPHCALQQYVVSSIARWCPLMTDLSSYIAAHFEGSLILDVAKKDKLVSWTSSFIASSGGKIWTHCYHANQGDDAVGFRASCLNKSPTVTVAKESSRNGIYGGYTSLPWTNTAFSYITKTDPTMFVFRLTDRVGGTTDDFKKCSADLMYDYYGYGPTLGTTINGKFWLYGSSVCLGDWDGGGCAIQDNAFNCLSFHRAEMYYLA